MKLFPALLLACLLESAGAAEPFFKPDDVVALVGGEEVVMMRDHPGLEMLVRHQPGLSGVRFRILAREGDTVFEQFRDLNAPSWEEQFRRIGATVVIAQFGKMEAMAGGPAGVGDFIAGYEKLLDRFAGSVRRVAVMSPMALALPARSAPAGDDARAAERNAARNAVVERYVEAQRDLAARRGWPFIDLLRKHDGRLVPMVTADGIHPARCYFYGWIPQRIATTFGLDPAGSRGSDSPVHALIREKNSLWFHYHRPQNWAFLAGDRTEQPSSRDHRDPTKRWFPSEMERWLPLVDAKDRQVQDAIEAARKP